MNLLFWKVKVFGMRLHRNQKGPLLVTAVILTLILLALYSSRFEYNEDHHLLYNITYQQLHKRIQELVSQEKSAGCVVPHLDPFSQQTSRNDDNVELIICDSVDWVECYLSECTTTKEIRKRMKHIVCIYTDIVYVNDGYYYFGLTTTVHGDENYTLNRSDHVKVKCTGMDVNGLGLIKSRWHGVKAGYRPVVKQNVTSPTSLPNILLFMFDSVSRNHFIRLMPKSLKVLTEELHAVVLKSFNVVGFTTDQNFLPILSGHAEMEIEASGKSPLGNHNNFIFNHLHQLGYHTGYYEEMPGLHTFKGFEHPPADHYLKPFYDEDTRSMKSMFWAGSRKRYCLGGRTHMGFLTNYTSQLFQLQGKKFGLAFSAIYSHENTNMLSMADEEMAQFFRRFKDDGRLEDTVLLVMGDHGPRFSIHRNTYQDEIESVLPFASIVLPEKLKRERPDALKHLVANAEVLTTPFDVHTSLLDLLGLKAYRNKHTVPGADIERGLSLLEPIPKSRSCVEADIVTSLCACATWHNVSSVELIYAQVARVLTEYIDSITEIKRNDCARRYLVSTEWVLRYGPSPDMQGLVNDGTCSPQEPARKPGHEYYQAKVTLGPENAVFEGAMLYVVKDDFFVIGENDITRINSYGDQPSCISRTHPYLNKYCFCRNKLPINNY